MRCPDCGARNAGSATWCSQCHAVFATPAAPAPPTSPTSAASATPPAAPAPTSSDRPVRERDGLVEWRCAGCGSWSPLTEPVCATCATPRQGFGLETARPDPLALRTGLAANAVLPGLGHVVAGRRALGSVTAFLAVAWYWLGISLLVGGSGEASVPGVVLCLGALVVHVGAILDARHLAEPRVPPVLDGPRLAWLVAGVGALVAAAVAVVALR